MPTQQEFMNEYIDFSGHIAGLSRCVNDLLLGAGTMAERTAMSEIAFRYAARLQEKALWMIENAETDRQKEVMPQVTDLTAKIIAAFRRVCKNAGLQDADVDEALTFFSDENA